MKIIQNLLYVLLGSIIIFCFVIGLGSFFPGLFGEKEPEPETTAVVEEAKPEEATEEPVSEPATEETTEEAVSEDNVPEISNEYFAEEASEDMPVSGLTKGISSDYVPGSTGEQKVSEALKKLAGLEAPKGEYEILSDEEADKIEAELSEGETGDDLEFDPEMYPYYNMLDNRGQHLYRQLYANSKALNDDFKAVEKDMPWASFNNVFEALFNDHPELFWLNTAYQANYRNSGDCLEIKLSFNKTAEDLEGSAQKFDEGATNIGSQADGSAYDKEKAVHDAIRELFSYNKGAEMNQSAYSGLVNNSTVCAGYARSFQYIMQQLGIPCYYCRGMAGEPHAWNIIKLDDGYYNVDVTWDDSDGGGEYAYFNLSDKDLNKDHRRTSLSVYLPPCNGSEYSGLEKSTESEKPAESASGNDAEHKNDKGAEGDKKTEDASKSDKDKDNEESEELPEGTYVSSLDEYYNACKERMMEKGMGNYTFDLYTTDEALYEECINCYNGDGAKDGFMQEVFDSVDGATNMTVEATGEKVGGAYKMVQDVQFE